MKTRVLMLIALLSLAIQASAKPDRPPVDQRKARSDLITNDAQKAIDTGLVCLAKQQAADGSFGTNAYKGNVAVTGLAGLAFLSAEPSENNDKVIANAVKYLLANEDANRPGYLISPNGFNHGPMYGHAFAVQFLADAHSRLGDKKQQKEVKALLDRSVKLIVKAQNNEGGWRYNPVPQDSDLTVTACQVAALHAARKAGIDVPKATLDNAIKYVKSCQGDGGGFRYQAFAGPPGMARTSAAVASLNALGAKDDEAAKKGMAYLKKVNPNLPGAPEAMHYFYGHQFAAKAMWYAGDKDFRAWYPGIRDELVKSQKDDRWEQNLMCPHFCTAMALVILQMPEGRLGSLQR
jgi:Prenyltransferase and squalene oxidase repeat